LAASFDLSQQERAMTGPVICIIAFAIAAVIANHRAPAPRSVGAPTQHFEIIPKMLKSRECRH
jgi:hypothetical protein